MKKFLVMAVVAAAMAVGVFCLNSDSALAGVKRAVGTYQCAICGVIEKVGHPSTELNERDTWGDGHTHDWRYIGGISGTIHPIK